MIEFDNYLPEYRTSEHRRHYVQSLQHKALISRKENCCAWHEGIWKQWRYNPRICNLGTRRSWVASCMYPPVPTEQDAKWDPTAEWMLCGKKNISYYSRVLNDDLLVIPPVTIVTTSIEPSRPTLFPSLLKKHYNHSQVTMRIWNIRDDWYISFLKDTNIDTAVFWYFTKQIKIIS